jgi:hypothetical protein
LSNSGSPPAEPGVYLGAIIILLTPRVMKSMQDVNDVTSEYTDRFSNVGIEKGKGKAPVGEINKGIKPAPKKTDGEIEKK